MLGALAFGNVPEPVPRFCPHQAERSWEPARVDGEGERGDQLRIAFGAPGGSHMKWIALMLVGTLTVLFGSLTHAQGTDELQTKLRQTIGGSFLRCGPHMPAGFLKFDTQGTLQHKSEVRPWTSNGVLRVKDIILTDQSLE